MVRVGRGKSGNEVSTVLIYEILKICFSKCIKSSSVYVNWLHDVYIYIHIHIMYILCNT